MAAILLRVNELQSQCSQQIVPFPVIGDDQILEPWWTQHAAVEGYGGSKWGLAQEFDRTGKNGDAMHMKASLDDWAKLDQLTVPHHHIDEEETARHVQKIGDVIGDLIEINVERGPICQGTAMDISTDLAQLRGMQEIMMDMYEYPDELHQILSFMRDGILQNHREAEEAGGRRPTPVRAGARSCGPAAWRRS